MGEHLNLYADWLMIDFSISLALVFMFLFDLIDSGDIMWRLKIGGMLGPI